MALLLLPVGVNLPSWILDGFKVVGILIGVMLAAIIFGVKKEKATLKMLGKISASIPILNRHVSRIVEFARALINGLKGISQDPKMFAVNMTLTWVLWLTFCPSSIFCF
jgi:hypothetical protein